MSSHEDKARWRAKQALTSPGLLKLQSAWQEWARADGAIPRRSHFDPFKFPPLLPLMLMAEITDEPNRVRPYDVLYRYVGTEFSTFFDSGKVTRARLSEIGAPFDERWFEISDRVLAARAPCVFAGSPLGTDYAHVDMEMLALPLARAGDAKGEVGFVLSALTQIYPDA